MTDKPSLFTAMKLIKDLRQDFEASRSWKIKAMFGLIFLWTLMASVLICVVIK